MRAWIGVPWNVFMCCESSWITNNVALVRQVTSNNERSAPAGEHSPPTRLSPSAPPSSA